jgi:hypothetical protein
LAVDGWVLRGRGLAPAAPMPLEEVRSRLRSGLEAREAKEALRRLDHLEKGLDEGHWESANADARGFLASVFDVIAGEKVGDGSKDGAARAGLEKAGFSALIRGRPAGPSKAGSFRRSSICWALREPTPAQARARSQYTATSSA